MRVLECNIICLYICLIAPMLTAVKCVHTNLETDPEVVRDAFSSFLSDICSTFKETQDQVEQVIVSQHK